MYYLCAKETRKEKFVASYLSMMFLLWFSQNLYNVYKGLMNLSTTVAGVIEKVFYLSFPQIFKLIIELFLDRFLESVTLQIMI